MNFFKSFLASCLGSLVAFVVLMILVFSLLAASVATLSSGNENVVVEDNSILHLKLDAVIKETEIENPLEGVPVFGMENASIGLIQLKNVLNHAANDAKIKGIYLDVSVFMGAYASAREVRQTILDFRKSGKWVIAYSEVMTEQAYYIASAADKVYLNPEGEMEFNGLAIEVTFFKKMFDKLEIKPEIFRVGDFKSAVEPFFLDKMSDANRLQLNELVKDINGNIVAEIAASRNIDPSKLMEISNKMLVTDTRKARQYNLVDSLVYYDQVLDDFKDRVGVEKESDLNFIKYNKYKKSFTTTAAGKNEIAVIVAEGDIVSGKAQQGTIGSNTFAAAIRKARLSKNVKAIVLRINSPGGSALASDVMWREVTLAAKEKPVIASMGDYAASGGYYLAMGCNTIVAQPTTITGSIGVFSVLFDMSGFLNNKLGITFDEVKTGDIGELITFTRPLTEPEKAILQRSTDRIYESFTSKAAEGRKMQVEDLRKIASGRVWTGAQAKENGLVDVLGNLDDAIEIAADKAGIKNDYKLKYYPKYKSFLEEWLNDLEENTKTNALKEELGPHFGVYKQLQQIKRYEGTQARMPFKLEIH